MNVSELTLVILQLGFLIVLWAFVFAIVYALRSDLFGEKVRRMPAQAAAPNYPPSAPLPPAPASAPAAPQPQHDAGSSAEASRLVITSGSNAGVEIGLPDEQLTIGRSSDSGLVIRDDYTSTHHARLLRWPDGWVIQDLDSTNGTFLDGERVHLPTAVPLGATVKIGTTTFELRR